MATGAKCSTPTVGGSRWFDTTLRMIRPIKDLQVCHPEFCPSVQQLTGAPTHITLTSWEGSHGHCQGASFAPLCRGRSCLNPVNPLWVRPRMWERKGPTQKSSGLSLKIHLKCAFVSRKSQSLWFPPHLLHTSSG